MKVIAPFLSRSTNYLKFIENSVQFHWPHPDMITIIMVQSKQHVKAPSEILFDLGNMTACFLRTYELW